MINDSNKVINISKFLFFLCNGLILLTLVIFTANHFFEQKNFFSSKLIISIIFFLTLLKLIYWQLIKSKINIKNKIKRVNFLKLTFIILTFALPIYMIFQEPYLIIDQQISKISFLLVMFFVIIGILIEKNLFSNLENNEDNIKYERDKI